MENKLLMLYFKDAEEKEPYFLESEIKTAIKKLKTEKSQS